MTPSGPCISLSLPGNEGDRLTYATLHPTVCYRAPDTLDLDIFQPEFVWKTSHDNGCKRLVGTSDTAELICEARRHSYDLIRVTTRMNFRQRVRVERICDVVRCTSSHITTAWAPHATPQEDMVVSETVMRTPVIALASAESVVAIIPNMYHLCRSRIPLAGTCDVDGREMTFGCIPHRHTHSVYFSHTDRDVCDNVRALYYTYYVYIHRFSPRDTLSRALSSRIWQLFGTACRTDDDTSRVTHRHTDVNEMTTCAISAMNPSDLTSQDVCFSPYIVRSAYGCMRAPRACISKELAQSAAALVEQHLSAPMDKGLFPVRHIPSHPPQWMGGSICGPRGHEEMYRLSDLSWTCYWLLKWHTECQSTPACLERAMTYAQALLSLQKTGGHIPTWVQKDSHKTVRILTRSAEIAAHVVFLSYLHSIAPSPEYVRACRRLGAFLVRYCCAHARWETTELYYGHSPVWEQKKPGMTDARQKRSPTDVGALCDVAYALLCIYRMTGTPRYLSEGRRVLDTLSLYQQLWSPDTAGWRGVGGFPGMDTDARWHTLVTTRVPQVYAAYYDATGVAEYIERSFASVRACRRWLEASEGAVHECVYSLKNHMPLIIKESEITHVLHAYSTLNEMHATYGDVYVDTSRMRAFADEGITISRVERELVGVVVYGRVVTSDAREIRICTDSGSHVHITPDTTQEFHVNV